MASFPTAAIVFASRSNGQVIDASHVGGLQDEISAMQDGYLNATARLNSSGSTVATLSVTGGSTFTGEAVFSTKIAPASTTVMLGDSTTGFKEIHCSSLYVDGAPFTASLPVYLRVSGSTTQLSSGGSTTAIAWPTDDFTSDTAMHSTATNPERFTPQSSGVYILSAHLTFSTMTGTNSTRSFGAEILDSSGGIVAWVSHMQPEAAGVTPGGGPTVTLSGMKYFDSVAGSTQWLRITMRNNSGSSLSLHATFCSAYFHKL